MSKQRPPHVYAPPLDRLLTLGCPGGDDADWNDVPFADYGAMGLGPEHADELLRMVRDARFDTASAPEAYAPAHAFRALAVLRVDRAVPGLIEAMRRFNKFNFDAWLEDMPKVFEAFGEPAIEPLALALKNQTIAFGVRLFVCDGLERLAVALPGQRDRIIGHMIDCLRYARWADPSINGQIIGTLAEIRAEAALPAIRAAFEGGWVDEQCNGPLEDVERHLRQSEEERAAALEERRKQWAEQDALREQRLRELGLDPEDPESDEVLDEDDDPTDDELVEDTIVDPPRPEVRLPGAPDPGLPARDMTPPSRDV